MNKVIKVLKNWWFALLGALIVVLDSGFNVINPILEILKIPVEYIDYVKAAFALYSIYKLQISLPTQNVDKLQAIVDDKKILLKAKEKATKN